jgi:hypothetical protein
VKNHRTIRLAAALAAGVSCAALAATGTAMAAGTPVGTTPNTTVANPLAVGSNNNPLNLPSASTAPLAADAGGSAAGAATVAATATGGSGAVAGTGTVAPSSPPIRTGNPGGSATASGTAGGNGSAPGGGGATPAAQDIASALAAIGTKNPAKMIRGVSGSTCAVTVVTIASSTFGADMQRLDAAIDRHEHKITKLQTALSGNSCISADLKAQDVAVGSVVAAREDTGGDVTLFRVPS